MPTIKNKSIYESTLLCSLLFLVFVKPEALVHGNEGLGRLYTYTEFFFTLILIIALFFRGRMDKVVIWLILFFGIPLLVTMMRGGSMYDYCRGQFPSLGLCLVFILWMERAPITLLSASRVLQLYIYINFYTVITYPEGLYLAEDSIDVYCWFLNGKNEQVRQIMPIVALSMMYSYQTKNRLSKSDYILIAISYATLIMVNSSTAIVGMTLFIVLCFIPNKFFTPLVKKLNLVTLFVAVALIGSACLYLSFQENFAFLIEDILHKEMDFTGRLPIWEVAIEGIEKEPIWGYGYMTLDDYAHYIGMAHNHPHNQVLFLLLRGGILLLIVELVGLWHSSRSLQHVKGVFASKSLFAVLACFILMGMTESHVNCVMLYPLYIMAMMAENLVAANTLPQETHIRHITLNYR